tara:strand:- start:58 stop:462 length:405 start_codon:yes stop_codon:yes gene_type:complete
MADVQIKTITDAFAYMLIYVAGVDGELSEEEAKANGVILAEFINHFGIDNDGDGDTDMDDLKSALTRAAATYFSCEDDEHVNIMVNCTHFIKENLSEQTCKAIISRLRTMTAADGTITEGEEGTVDVVEKMMLG